MGTVVGRAVAQCFHTGKAAFAGESEELLPWLRPTGFLQNIPFTWKLLPSEDCWLWLACQPGKRHKGSVSVEIGDTKEGEGVVLCWILSSASSIFVAGLGEGGVGIGKES